VHTTRANGDWCFTSTDFENHHSGGRGVIYTPHSFIARYQVPLKRRLRGPRRHSGCLGIRDKSVVHTRNRISMPLISSPLLDHNTDTGVMYRDAHMQSTVFKFCVCDMYTSSEVWKPNSNELHHVCVCVYIYMNAYVGVVMCGDNCFKRLCDVIWYNSITWRTKGRWQWSCFHHVALCKARLGYSTGLGLTTITSKHLSLRTLYYDCIYMCNYKYCEKQTPLRFVLIPYCCCTSWYFL
jgi:hypothetical protein